MDFQKKAEEVWDKADSAFCEVLASPEDMVAAIAVIAAALEQAYKEGYTAAEARIKELEEGCRIARDTIASGLYAYSVKKTMKTLDALLSKSEEVK